MRQSFTLLLLFCSAIIYSQNTSSVFGKLTDKEYNNEPLAFATVSIKGSINETTANLDGLYHFKNLKPGEYTLVYSFVGYETKEKRVLVTAEKTSEVNVLMGAIKPSINKVVTTSTESQENDIELSSSKTKA